MPTISAFEDSLLEAICKTLADTSTGLTGNEIGCLLSQLDIHDPETFATKKSRLLAALKGRQTKDRCGNQVVAFIQAAMDPVRYIQNLQTFYDRRDKLNLILTFGGFSLGEDGKLSRSKAASTLTEAQHQANLLRSELTRRGVHPDVIQFCRTELVQENVFHAILEATKSVADKIRKKTGLSSDGAPLVDEAMGLKKSGIPLLALNTLTTDTEVNEHHGLMNLLKGMFGMFRNVTAHEPKIKRTISQQDALDAFTTLSFLHRQLDNAVSTARPS